MRLTSNTSIVRRRPRFERGNQTQRARLTERDLDILEQVANHRFLRALDAARLVGGSEKKVIERVGQLFYAGYLDRPAAQGEYYRAGGGSEPIIYAISNEGARVLIEAKRLAPSRALTWARKNDEVKRPSIHHTLSVADLSIRLVNAATARGDIHLQLRSDLLKTLPAQTQAAKSPFTLTVPLIHQGAAIKISNKPDLAFGLVYPDGNRRCFLVEVDRGSMPVERKNFDQTSILRKLIGYETARQQELHKSQFGWRNFRVLFVTDTASRADSIIKAIASRDRISQSPLFLVTDRASLETSADIFTHQWRTPTRYVDLIS